MKQKTDNTSVDVIGSGTMIGSVLNAAQAIGVITMSL